MLNISSILLGVPIVLIALTVHEFAHGFVSEKLGDPTPRYQGRLTLNPLAHLDLMGTVLMILTGFGWAKPVSINPNYYKDRTKGMALVALAGPLANFIVAILAILIGAIISMLFNKAGISTEFIEIIMFAVAWRNLCFMVFNLIPLPPLDGFKVAGMFIPKRIYYNILRYEHYVIYAIMALSLLGVFNMIIGTGARVLINLIYGFTDKLLSILFW